MQQTAFNCLPFVCGLTFTAVLLQYTSFSATDNCKNRKWIYNNGNCTEPPAVLPTTSVTSDLLTLSDGVRLPAWAHSVENGQPVTLEFDLRGPFTVSKPSPHCRKITNSSIDRSDSLPVCQFLSTTMQPSTYLLSQKSLNLMHV